MRTSAKLAAAGCAAALLVPAGPAAAGDRAETLDGSEPVVATGTCSAGSTWQLAGIARFRKIGVRLTIDSATPGQRWVLVGAHNRRRIVVAIRKSDVNGDVVVKRRVRNVVGVDRFRVWAKNRQTKEVCRARLVF